MTRVLAWILEDLLAYIEAAPPYLTPTQHMVADPRPLTPRGGKYTGYVYIGQL